MKNSHPDISRQINYEDTHEVLESNYSTLGPLWVSSQMDWFNGIFAAFKDHDKYLIVMFLVKRTLDFYSRNFIELSYDEFYSNDTVEIEKINISEVSKNVNIPKESARRKIIELENSGVIKKIKKKIIIDRSAFFYVKPENTIKRIARFLSTFSEKLVLEKKLQKPFSTEDLEKIIKSNFSYIWKTYYELQIPMMLGYKNIFIDLETFHIFGTCVVNQHLAAKKLHKGKTNKKMFIESTYQTKNMVGLNTMSISDITGIPRATVIRKLKKLIKEKHLVIDSKKHYKMSGSNTKKLAPLQNIVLERLSKFSTHIYNLPIL